MNIIKISKYGAVLTGREFGSNVATALLEDLKFPVSIDFAGVEALGSSFGDEVIPALASKQGNIIKIINANNEVKATLRDVAFDSNIKIELI
jgi:hypothetical protein